MGFCLFRVCVSVCLFVCALTQGLTLKSSWPWTCLTPQVNAGNVNLPTCLFFPPFFKIVVKYIKTATEPFCWAWIFQTGQDLTMWPRLTAELSPPASASRRYMGFTHALPLWILFKQVLVLFFLGILFYFILFEKCGGLKIEPRIAFISLCGSPWLLFQSPKC